MVLPCLAEAPMTLTGGTHLYAARVLSCDSLDGQAAAVHSNVGGSDSAPLQ